VSELHKLEQELAYSAARSDIECHCMARQHSGQHHGWWYDTTTVTGDDVEWVEKAMRYLDLRKVLKRHPDNAALVRIE
jgi:hypothetical protein